MLLSLLQENKVKPFNQHPRQAPWTARIPSEWGHVQLEQLRMSVYFLDDVIKFSFCGYSKKSGAGLEGKQTRGCSGVAGDMRGLGAMVVKASSTESRMPQSTKPEHLQTSSEVISASRLYGNTETRTRKETEDGNK